ncbi:MAG TPA: hypothetical protein VFH77_16105 [Streptomyces sp.]|nr:hypothetical protein [Streptomyces sp.]
MRTTFRTVALTAATGILATGTVAGTALAATAAPAAAPAASVLNTPGDNDLYQGQVIARPSLNIRALPTTNSSTRGTPIPYGTVIRVSCKVVGQNIDGNRLWYKMADARFAPGWVTARYVDNIGRAPEYCPRDTAEALGSAVGEAPAKKQNEKQADKQAQKQESDAAPLG